MSDFDIIKHQFSDGSIELNSLITCDNEVCFNALVYINPFADFVLNKQDGIAIARHFKLTAEDL